MDVTIDPWDKSTLAFKKRSEGELANNKFCEIGKYRRSIPMCLERWGDLDNEAWTKIER